MEQIITGHRGEEIVIFAHGGVNRIILCHALGLDLRYIFRIEQGYYEVISLLLQDTLIVVWLHRRK